MSDVQSSSAQESDKSFVGTKQKSTDSESSLPVTRVKPTRHTFNKRRNIVVAAAGVAGLAAVVSPFNGSNSVASTPVASTTTAPTFIASSLISSNASASSNTDSSGPGSFGTPVTNSLTFSTGSFGSPPCAQNGNGKGDPDLDMRKNRDKPGGQATPVAIDQVVGLHVGPIDDEGTTHREEWSPDATKAALGYENSYVTIEGYMSQARDEGSESCNCAGSIGVDTHTWITPQPHGNRGTTSMVAEISPRLKGAHPTWNQKGFSQIASNQTRVRITGWIMYDQEHVSEIGKSRGTVWEIHPVHAIQIQAPNGTWTDFK